MQVDIAEPADCVPGEPVSAAHVAVPGDRAAASAYDVDGLLADSAAYAVAATDAVGARGGHPLPERVIDLDHLLAWCTTHVEIDGEVVPAWGDLSGVYPTADRRHLQIHCNFEHHAAGVVARLGCHADRESVAAAIVERNAFEIEADLIADGMIGAVVRTLDEWDAHPHASATRDLPLVTVERIGDADPIVDRASVEPLSHLRVLDCSRVLAGPVAGQILAALGADVLRVGAAHLPTVPVGVIATGFGKRNTSLDLRTRRGRDSMQGLLASGDVWIDAYRPGALAGFDLSPDRVAALRPGIVIVQISAFDWSGPWAGRRGFDSIVQSTTGVRWAGGELARGNDGRHAGRGPIGLPVQALDYATGFLAAGAAAQLVAHQRRVGGSWLARLSLLRTRDWLARRSSPHPFVPAPVPVDADLLETTASPFGRLRTVRPFVGSNRWAPQPLGSVDPAWSAS